MFAESSGKLSMTMSPGSDKLLNSIYPLNKVEDAILQWSAPNRQETEETRDTQWANQKSFRHLKTITNGRKAEWVKLGL